MRRFGHHLMVYLTMAAISVGVLGLAGPASASRKGRVNTARALTGVAAYHLLKGHGPETLLFGGGAYYAWQQAKKAPRHHHHWRMSRHHRHHNNAYSR